MTPADVDPMWFLSSALNVKIKKFKQALVNGGSNYGSLSKRRTSGPRSSTDSCWNKVWNIFGINNSRIAIMHLHLCTLLLKLSWFDIAVDGHVIDC